MAVFWSVSLSRRDPGPEVVLLPWGQGVLLLKFLDVLLQLGDLDVIGCLVLLEVLNDAHGCWDKLRKRRKRRRKKKMSSFCAKRDQKITTPQENILP